MYVYHLGVIYMNSLVMCSHHMGLHSPMPSAFSGKQIHNMRGYMGHLRKIANAIVQQAEFGPNEHRIKKLIQVCCVIEPYVEGVEMCCRVV